MEENTRSERNNSKDFFTGVIIGAVAGSLAALLFAPKSGRELRQRLNEQVSAALEKSDQVRDSVRNLGGEFRDYANETRIKLTKTVQDQTKELAEKVQTMTKHAEKNANETLEEAQKTIAELSDEIDKKFEELK